MEMSDRFQIILFPDQYTSDTIHLESNNCIQQQEQRVIDGRDPKDYITITQSVFSIYTFCVVN